MKQSYINLFNIVGPIMVGPSSSHTAGAAIIGFRAFQNLGEKPQKIRIKLFNSFSDTGFGHKTELATLGGCIGIKPDSKTLKDADRIAKKMGVDYKIKTGYHTPDLHPNSVIIDLIGDNFEAGLVGFSIGGGRVVIPKKYRRKIGDKKTNVNLSKVSKRSLTNNSQQTYLSFAEIKDQVNTGRQFLKLLFKLQEESYNQTATEVIVEFGHRWQIMVQAIKAGISNYRRSEDNMFGGDSYRMRRSKLNVLSKIIEDSIVYAIGVSEHNARMGRIVASPTAGAAGITPGVLRAMQEKFQFSDQKMAEALVIAAGIGAIVANKVALAGAVAGCQAEIGVAGAMTAAAGAYLLGGDIEAIEAAASLVLANLLGLTCDPVMGKVEVPCILRNGVVASMTFAGMEMAMDNIRYTIPFDEVVTVMKKVGQDMHYVYKETGEGGLAKTKTAKTLCQNCPHCR